jgi:hypothetical protein
MDPMVRAVIQELGEAFLGQDDVAVQYSQDERSPFSAGQDGGDERRTAIPSEPFEDFQQDLRP